MEITENYSFKIPHSIRTIPAKTSDLIHQTKKAATEQLSRQPELLHVLKHADRISFFTLICLDKYFGVISERTTGIFLGGILACQVANAAKEFLRSLEESQPKQQKAMEWS